MRVRPLLRVGGVLGAAALTLGAIAPVSHAERTEVSFYEVGWGVFYDNKVNGVDPDDPLALYAGATLDDRCNEEFVPATIRARTKGDTGVERLVDRGPLYVYDAGDILAEDLADKYCAGKIARPELVAVGEGTIRFRIELDGGAPRFVVNTVNGSVRTPAGDNWAVNGYAELVFDPGPNPQNVSFTIRNQR